MKIQNKLRIEKIVIKKTILSVFNIFPTSDFY